MYIILQKYTVCHSAKNVLYWMLFYRKYLLKAIPQEVYYTEWFSTENIYWMPFRKKIYYIERHSAENITYWMLFGRKYTDCYSAENIYSIMICRKFLQTNWWRVQRKLIEPIQCSPGSLHSISKCLVPYLPARVSQRSRRTLDRSLCDYLLAAYNHRPQGA